MRVTYGIEVMETDDIYIEAAEKAVKTAIKTGVPGAFLVDSFPIRIDDFLLCHSITADVLFLRLVKYIPDWFPGASFKRLGKMYRQSLEDMKCMPLNATKDAMVTVFRCSMLRIK